LVSCDTPQSVNSTSPCASHSLSLYLFFFFNDTATTDIYTLSLHDALPIRLTRSLPRSSISPGAPEETTVRYCPRSGRWPVSSPRDRKSTRLNSSHRTISYAVFCLKKKTK